MNKKTSKRLNVEKVLADFQRAEESSAHHSGTFKIDATFEKVLDSVLKAKPEGKKRRRKVK